MNAKDAMKASLDSTMYMMKMFLEDLSDADFLVRPVPNANHIAWQLGHLIVSEADIAKAIPDAKPAELPAGFAAKYTKETAKLDSPAAFHKKAELLAAYRQGPRRDIGDARGASGSGARYARPPARWRRTCRLTAPCSACWPVTR